MNYDPYQAPAGNPGQYQSPPAFQGQLSQQAAQELLGTQGWVRFVSVLMLIGSALMLLGGLMGLLMSSTLDSAYSRYGDYRRSGWYSGVLPLLLFVVIALLYLYPAILLSKYASAIRRYRYSGHMNDVTEALRHQRYFWRFVGIIGIVILSIYAVIFLGGIAISSSRRL